jgi:hypothetical protein
VPALTDKKNDQPVGTPINVASKSRYELFSPVVLTLVIAMVALFSCEAAVRFIVYVGKPSLTENPQYHVKFLVAKKVTSEQDNILLMGDSLMKAGIYPELITAKLRKINKRIRVVNLAVNGSTQTDAIAYLEFLREKGIKPRVVVYDYEVANTGSNSTANNSSYKAASLNSLAPAIGMAQNAATPAPVSSSANKSMGSSVSRGYLFDGLLSRPNNFWKSCELFCADQLYLVRYRASIKTLILEFLKACKFPARFERKSYVEPTDWDDYGTTPDGMSPNHKLIFEENRSDQAKAIATSRPTSPQSEYYKYRPDAYQPIIEYCQLNQIPLVLLWLPHQSSIYREFYYRAPYTESWFRQQFESYAQKQWVHPVFLNTLSEDSNFFTDYRHLSTYGCVKATELFAAALQDPKYVALVKPSDTASEAKK